MKLRIVFAAAAFVRLAVVFGLSNFEHVRLYETSQIIPNMLAGKGIAMHWFGSEVPIASYPPVYLWFLYLIQRVVGPNMMIVEVCQALIGSLVVIPAYFLARRLLSPLQTTWAVWAVALYPVHAYYCARIQAVFLDILLVTAVVAIFVNLDAIRGRKAVACGVVLGLGLLSRFQFAPYAAAMALWFGMRNPQLKRPLAILLASAGLAMSPWIVRNAVQFGQPMVTGGGGYQLWVGNNPRATGAVFGPDQKPIVDHLPQAMKDEMAALPTEATRDAVFRREAVTEITSHPGRFLKRIPKKLFYLWWYDPYLPTSFGTVRVILYAPLLALTLLGLWRARGRWAEFLPVWSVFVLMSAFYAVFFATARFRYLFEPLMMLYAAVGASSLWARVSYFTPSDR